MTIAVDFDGTIVEHNYPKIGKERPFAFETLKALQAEGHRLILWTSRDGALLDEAVEFCRKHGLTFYAVNSSVPADSLFAGRPNGLSSKIQADLYIDDHNLGGLPEWGEIYTIVNGKHREKHRRRRRGLFSWLKKH